MSRFRTVLSLTLVTLLLVTVMAPMGAAASGRAISVGELLQGTQPAPQPSQPADPEPPQPSQPSQPNSSSSGNRVSVGDLLRRSGQQPNQPAPSEPSPPAPPEEPSQPEPQPSPPPNSGGIRVEDLLNPRPPQQQPSPPSSSPGTLPPLPSGLTSAERQMVNAVNEERIAAGVAPLTVDMELVRLARMKAQDITEYNYSGHNSPTYGPPHNMVRQAGYQFTRLGETIAKAGSAAHAHRLLMNSMAHRNILLSPDFTKIGTGIDHYNGRHNIHTGLAAVHLLAK